MSTEIIGIAAGICTAISLLPQLIKIIREKEARNISLFYLVILLAGLSLWIWYGILREDLPIIATNITSIVLNIAIIILGIRYKRRER
ncbi:SemiSWEET family sugar transporter [Ohtaekwangia kribbensis]|jgi:MtN3 and saliva related transmembrane protein|uniref:SemiSWEET family sugar transporter n=1 Tax=Ohtaekwangia kribbensis TaxID=688913 RepID=A0ABW3K4T5_9BACT